MGDAEGIIVEHQELRELEERLQRLEEGQRRIEALLMRLVPHEKSVESDERAQVGRLLRALRDAMGDRSFTLAEAFASGHEELQKTLAEMQRNPRSIGKLLLTWADRSVDYLRVKRQGSEAAGAVWCVESVFAGKPTNPPSALRGEVA